MTVKIITRVDYTRYSIHVIVDGTVKQSATVEHYEVLKVRNEYCETWAEQADIVTATQVPQIPTLKGGPLERRIIER